VVDFQIKKDKFHSETLPSSVIVRVFFEKEAQALSQAQSNLETISEELNEFHENNSSEEDLISDYFNDKGRILRKELTTALKDKTLEAEISEQLHQYKSMSDREDSLKEIKSTLEEDLTAKIVDKYNDLDEKLVKNLIIEEKWLKAVSDVIYDQLDFIVHTFTERLIELEQRYRKPLPLIEEHRRELSVEVHRILEDMGVKWQ
jgi:type I restriction enzyme M protein